MYAVITIEKMKLLIFVLLYFVCTSDGQMMGGDKAADGQFPFAVQLFEKTAENTDSFICGGAIIDEHFVITAAHCVLEQVGERGTRECSGISVVVGTVHSDEAKHPEGAQINSEQKEKRKVDKIIPYRENYYETDDIYDLALLYFKNPLPVSNAANSFVKKIKLANLGNNESILNPPTEHNYTMLGWGCTKWKDESHYDIQNDKPVPKIVFPERQCCLKYDMDAKVVDNSNCFEKNRTLEHCICLRSENKGGLILNGDSGSPLVYKLGGEFVLAGIAHGSSFDFNINYQKKTLDVKLDYQVYVKVTSEEVINWIINNLGETKHLVVYIKIQDTKVTLILMGVIGMIVAYI